METLDPVLAFLCITLVTAICAALAFGAVIMAVAVYDEVFGSR